MMLVRIQISIKMATYIITAPNSDDVVRRYPIEIFINQGDDQTFIKETNFILNNLGYNCEKTIIGDFNGDRFLIFFSPIYSQ